LGLTRNNSTASGISGYQVQKDGTIELPIIGKLKVVNQTTDEISALIKNKLIVDYKEPYVYVNLIGRVIVLGSNSPGPVSLFNERLTILEAIALSGDVKFSSRKDRVWLIREQNGERKSVLLDLTSPEIFQSPYFYLKTNDLVYIEPSRFMSFIEGNAPSRNLFLSAVSIVALIIALIK
jgi:polysaccharide export outer membrane protein